MDGKFCLINSGLLVLILPVFGDFDFLFYFYIYFLFFTVWNENPKNQSKLFQLFQLGWVSDSHVVGHNTNLKVYHNYFYTSQTQIKDMEFLPIV